MRYIGADKQLCMAKSTVIYWIIGIAVILLFAGFGALVARADTAGMAALIKMVRAKFPRVRQLPPAELSAWLADSTRPAPVLLDVRTIEEYQVSHLPRATHADPATSAKELAARLNPSQTVVVYCSVGYRASALAEQLMQAGFTKVYNLEGAIFAWANEDRPLESNGQPAAKVHPSSAKYGRLLKADKRANIPAGKP